MRIGVSDLRRIVRQELDRLAEGREFGREAVGSWVEEGFRVFWQPGGVQVEAERSGATRELFVGEDWEAAPGRGGTLVGVTGQGVQVEEWYSGGRRGAPRTVTVPYDQVVAALRRRGLA